MLTQTLLLALASTAHALVAPRPHVVAACRTALAATPIEPPPNPIAQDAPIYALAAALQAVPIVLQSKECHYVFFLGLATATVYLSSRACSLAPPEAVPLTLKQAALAPVLASAAAALAELHAWLGRDSAAAQEEKDWDPVAV